MANTVLAVDPGKTTGWAMWSVQHQHFTSGQESWLDFLLIFEQRADRDPGLHVVSESFIINAGTLRKGREHWSLEAIGAMKYILQRQGLPDLVLQSPATGKKFGTDDKLKAMDWWLPNNGHANDAARHLLTFMMRDPKRWSLDPSPLLPSETQLDLQ